jgi:hypothetical protein
MSKLQVAGYIDRLRRFCIGTSCRMQNSQGGCKAQWLLLLVFLAIFLASCGGGDTAVSEISELELKLTQEALAATQQALGATQPQEQQADEATAEAPGGAEQPQTEEPAQQTGEEVVQEPVMDAAATEAAQELANIAATEAASSTAADAQRAAELEPIKAEVASYGVDPNQGNLGFTHPPITIEENDFEDVDWKNQNLLTVARDFVLAADVTWNSAYAESGCGFAIRSDGDEEDPSQYLVGMTRGAQGHVLFAEQVQGDVDLNQVTDIYANGIDPLFEWQNDTTNRIAIVARGQEFTIYSNGTRLGTITGQSGFEEGFVAFFALNRSGGVRCHFDNAWLWRMD